MDYWLIADTHFGHKEMIDYCGRPVGFEKKILKQMDVVQKDDILIHLGDFALGIDEMWHEMFMQATNGKKWLIKGNHDRKTNTWYCNHGWDCVADELVIKMFGNVIAFTHQPITRQGYDINIHGHHHNTNNLPKNIVDNRNILIALEHDYRPVNLKKLMRKKQKGC